jgi:hypothetical protein
MPRVILLKVVRVLVCRTLIGVGRPAFSAPVPPGLRPLLLIVSISGFSVLVDRFVEVSERCGIVTMGFQQAGKAYRQKQKKRARVVNQIGIFWVCVYLIAKSDRSTLMIANCAN